MRKWFKGWWLCLFIGVTILVINAACGPNGYFCRLFSAVNLPTWFLVLIGGCGIFAALKTLVAIERQTKAVEDSIDVLVNKERARIYIEPDKFHLDFADEYDPKHELIYKIICVGTTPAIIYDSRISAEVGVTQERSQRPAVQIPLPSNLVPGETEWRISLFGESEHLDEMLGEQIESGKLSVNLWGHINYRDIFFKGDGFWRKNFRYTWNAQESRFIKCGESWENAENKKTPAKNPN
jgi:hypothetical protein